MNRRAPLASVVDRFRRGPDRDLSLRDYRTLALHYDAACARIRHVRRSAIDLLALGPGDVVFDVACGTGETLVELAHRVSPGGRVIGIEQSPEMCAAARRRVALAGLEACVAVIEAPVEHARLDAHADAVLFCYAHDVLQTPSALANVFSRVKPGARVAAAGGRTLPWWWGWPLNIFTLVRARRYVSTYRGISRPWRHLAASHCADFREAAAFHFGTSYVGFGTHRLAEGRSGG